jgi:TonB family protein
MPREATAPVQITRGAENLLHGSLPEYPARAIAEQVQGDVVLDLSVDDRGQVFDARVISGPEELRRAALQSALEWHYSSQALRSTSVQATIHFRLPEPGELQMAMYDGRTFGLANDESHTGELTPAQRAERRLGEIQRALQQPGLPEQEKAELSEALDKAKRDLASVRGELAMARREFAGAREEREGVNQLPALDGAPRLARVRSERVPAGVLQQIMSTAGLRVGDPLGEDAAKHLRKVAASIDEHLRVSFLSDGSGGVVVSIIAP